MKTLFGKAAFAAGGTMYHWEDVVLAAELRGKWAKVRERVRQGIACLERMKKDEDCLSEEEVESAENEFRYERDLVSAEEMEDWLDRWGLTAESWMDYIRWSLLRRKWSDQLPGLVSAYPAADEAVERLVKSEALCSGDLERFARELAGRAAVHEKLKETSRSDGGTFEALQPDPSELGLLELDAKVLREKTETLARLEASFEQFRERVLTPKAIETWVRAQQADWTRVDCCYVSFPDEDMAREAALAVRADGRQLAEVAADARTAFHRDRFFIDEFEPSVRGSFLSARKGELVGPLELDGAFALYLLLEKAQPSTDDADIIRRAEETLLKRLVDREIDDRVKWYERF